MKFDLFTSIGVAIVGVLVAFFTTNLLIQPLEDYKFTAIDDAANSNSSNGYNYADLTPPNNEVFNYDALNPTVEVYVGECEAYDENGNCLEDQVDEDEEDTDAENGESDTETDDSNQEVDEQENR